MASAVVTADGEMVASRSHDRGRLERTVGAITSALAAGQALGELLPGDDASEAGTVAADDVVAGDGVGDSDEASAEPSTRASAISSVMLMFEDGPILLTPLANPHHVVVLALASERDLGRARLTLRSFMARLSAAVAPVK